MKYISAIIQIFRLLLLFFSTGAISLLIPHHRYKKKEETIRRVVKFCYKAGPTFVKLAQFLSTRPDIIGRHYAESLNDVKDKLPPFPYKDVERIFYKDFSKKIKDVFEYFDENPIAAASVAQVHNAKLSSGEMVAVKILRPNIPRMFERDVKIISLISRIYNTFYKNKIDICQLIKLKNDVVFRELNMRIEAASSQSIKKNTCKDKKIYIPDVFWNFVSNNILTMEYCDVPSLNAILHDNYDGRCKKYTKDIAYTLFHQIYRDGFFHADMHEGNILIDERNDKIVLLDFGICCHISEENRLFLAKVINGFVKRDYHGVAKAYMDYGHLPKDTSLNDFALACCAIGEPITGLPVKDIQISRLIKLLIQASERFSIKMHPEILLLNKSIIILEGVCYKMDRDINMWKTIDPWIKAWYRENNGIISCLDKRRKSLSEIYCDFAKIPSMVELVCSKVGRRNNNHKQIVSIIIICTIITNIFFFIK